MQSILVLGGDGFCGWPTALHLSAKGYRVCIIDNLSRRRIDDDMGYASLTPISRIEERLSAWRSASGNIIEYKNIDIASDYHGLRHAIRSFEPTAVVHFAEQRSAPFSMMNSSTKCYTVDNNMRGTHNLLVAIVDLDLDVHVVHLGTTGVYGYGGVEWEIPEGYLDVIVKASNGRQYERTILFPTMPGSVYHLTKSMDQLIF